MLLSLLPAESRVLDIECSQVIHVAGKWVTVTVWYVPDAASDARYVAIAAMCHGLHLPAEIAHGGTVNDCIGVAMNMLESYVSWVHQ